jgi:hypothetical protein
LDCHHVHGRETPVCVHSFRAYARALSPRL